MAGLDSACRGSGRASRVRPNIVVFYMDDVPPHGGRP